ncbi:MULTISPECIES: co-chaperone YbbN [unclassified Paenibacillus]|uniref:thioredoxin family protein n=1 Tax=unclassified Paenibacillus TaxID=185978 RepID=UPI001E2E6B8A|nr:MULTISPECIES: thioredoxin domain-containing protein [unclassified Paenibacillus]CAH0121163.1 hypothetical protein PAE9249_03689 [Paenibacillus sp. CECT 9249]
MMREISEHDVLQTIASRREPLFLYLYTPLCGTCKAAERMLDIVMETLNTEAMKTNVNFAPRLVAEFRIESVPCLLAFRSDEGEAPEKLYAFQSVTHLFHFMNDKRCDHP